MAVTFDQDFSEEIMSVSVFTRRVKTLLEQSIPPGWIKGEISNLRHQASGHIYFSLKDADSQVSAVMFRGNAARLDFDLQDGMEVLAYGEISVYEPRGNYQLIVRAMVEDGLGRLQQEFERLKRQLAAEGIFDEDRKSEIPSFPSVVGIITSSTGAAVQDFIRILKRRGWRGRLLVFPAKVQGEGASKEMIDALGLAGSSQKRTRGKRKGLPPVDLLVIGRGGGSIEDLWAFNEEALARAVGDCPIPIISAVGHEIDFTLCDFAADVRAETPSAAAELISSEFIQTEERVEYASAELMQIVDDKLRELRDQCSIVAGRLALLSPKAKVEQGLLRLDDLTNRLGSFVREQLSSKRHAFVEASSRLGYLSPEPEIRLLQSEFESKRARFERVMEVLYQSKMLRLNQAQARLEPLAPDSVLKRGFAMVHSPSGDLVDGQKLARKAKDLTLQFHDGEVGVKVRKD